MEEDDLSPPLEHEVFKGEDYLTASSTSTFLVSRSQEGEEDNAAPVDFQVVSSSSDGGDVENFDSLSPQPFPDKVQCPLCRRRRERITCTTCLNHGDFYVQNRGYRDAPQSRERYAELLQKFQVVQKTLEELKKKCSEYTRRRARILEIQDEIAIHQSTIELEKKLKESLHARILNAQKESQDLSLKSAEKLQMWPVFRKRLDNMKAQYIHNCTKLKKFHAEVHRRQENLKRGTRSRILQLRKDVFAIKEISSNSRGSSRKGEKDLLSWSDEEDDTVRSLMVAKRNDVWSRPDELVSSFGTCYSITGEQGPTLPASGDYSAYNMWVERNQTPLGVTSSSSSYRNPAHCIAAALTYTTQFVNLIAYYLDLRLPHRLSYSEFRNGDLINGKFNKKVAKLNANVIHMCSSQGIHATSLQPRKTIPNLLLLFDDEQADLGRRGPFEVASQLAKSMEDSIEKDLQIVVFNEGDASDEEWFPSDWETINRGAVEEEFGLGVVEEMKATELPSPIGNTSFMGNSSSSMFRSSSANSLGGGGLLSSVTSLFRWGK